MDERDTELDNLLSGLREERVSDLMIQRWKLAVRRELVSNRPLSRVAQLAAALVVGFILGHLIEIPRSTVEESANGATIEHVFAKSD